MLTYTEYFLSGNTVFENQRTKQDWVHAIERLMDRARYFRTLGVALPDPAFEARRKFGADSIHLDGGFGNGVDPL